MTNTTYYNLNIVEGTDIVNPLIVDNPNYEKIDEVMHDNAVSGVTLATEIANATVHAISRENSECSVIRFIATSKWKAGDTITVDGVPVTALLPSGETLPDGAYVINANVLCILTGTNLTVYAERKKTYSANEIAYSDTTVSAELDKINNNLSIQKITQNTSLLSLVGQLQLEGTRKMFYAPKASYFSDFPTQLSSTAIESPFITISRLDGVYVLIEIVSFNSTTGIPKSIKGVCNWSTGAFGWDDVV